MSLYAPMILLCAAILALTGTNAQARLAKKRQLADEDRDVVAAARLWSLFRWLQRPSGRRALALAEARGREDREHWTGTSICAASFDPGMHWRRRWPLRYPPPLLVLSPRSGSTIR
jgi:hypothetical protein